MDAERRAKYHTLMDRVLDEHPDGQEVLMTMLLAMNQQPPEHDCEPAHIRMGATLPKFSGKGAIEMHVALVDGCLEFRAFGSNRPDDLQDEPKRWDLRDPDLLTKLREEIPQERRGEFDDRFLPLLATHPEGVHGMLSRAAEGRFRFDLVSDWDFGEPPTAQEAPQPDPDPGGTVAPQREAQLADAVAR